MAVPVYISNEKGATEVAEYNRATKEIALVNPKTPGAVPVKLVSSTVRGVQAVRIVDARWITPGETL